MPEAVKFVAFIPSHQSEKSGKLVPAKAKDGNDREFTIPEKWSDFVSSHQGQTVEIEFTESVNGKWTNRNLTSVKLPESPKTQPTGNGGSWKRDPEEGRLIVRQSSLKAAVDSFNGRAATTKEILAVAETFTAWVYGQVVAGGSIAATQPAAPVTKPHVQASLKPEQSLADAVNEILTDENDALADLASIPPADAPPSTRTPYPSRETLRPSRSAVR